MFSTKVMAVFCAAATMSLALFAQQPAPVSAPAQTTTVAAAQVPDGGMPAYVRPETPEQRRARLGTAEDPGVDPDPSKHFWRFGRSFHIEKFDRTWSAADQKDPAFIRPYAPLNVIKELYQQNDKFVWVWMPDYTVEETLPPPKEASGLTADQIKTYESLRGEFATVDVPESGKALRFVESSNGLPQGGSYRNSLAVADINEDGCPDIVTPPQRGGNGIPEIYLGDCKGHWTGWAKTTWPFRMDYGSVVAADFNRDGHVDLAFGIHLQGVKVLLGDGKGNFVDASSGIASDFPTRRVAVADVDHDGYPDVVALSEGPAAAMAGMGGNQPKMRVYLNREKGKSWQMQDVSASNDPIGGDWLSVGNFNTDAYPDFLAASVYFNGPDIIWASSGKQQYKNVGGGTLVPWLSYYFANTTGHFTSKKFDDAILSYVRTWPDNVDARVVPPPASKSVSGIDRISFSGKEPVRTSIIRWTASHPVWGMAAADIDGDGNLDLLFTQANPRTLEILLGDGKGHFRRASVEGLALPTNTNYDIKVADVNGDGKPDIILAYESAELTAFAAKNGSVHVFLNRGMTEAPKQAEK
jgi:hypothetical protein